MKPILVFVTINFEGCQVIMFKVKRFNLGLWPRYANNLSFLAL
ncbi:MULTISPECIES: hypothetical protein [Moorena]|nr:MULTISPECIES: hypothetical protein [Moorena]